MDAEAPKKGPKLSLTGVPTIPMNEPISWEDWKAGHAQRRKTGMRVAPEVIRRDKSSADRHLKRLFKGQRGLPFKSSL